MKLYATEVPTTPTKCPFASLSPGEETIDIFRDTPEEIAKKRCQFIWKCALWGGRCSLDMPEYFDRCNRLISFDECMKGDLK